VSAWDFSSFVPYAIAGWLMEPLAVLQLALLVILIPGFRRRWRGKEIDGPARWSIDPAMFVTACVLLFCVGLLIPAVGAWYGVALYLSLGMT
jgi:hypothetical protein